MRYTLVEQRLGNEHLEFRYVGDSEPLYQIVVDSQGSIGIAPLAESDAFVDQRPCERYLNIRDVAGAEARE